jgi:hypothetical protein
VRQKALVIAHGMHESGRREVIGLDVGEAETESFWRAFLRSLVARGLGGVLLCISDAHQGLENAIGKVLGVPWQRWTVHFLRVMLGHVQRSQQQMVGAAIRQVFAAPTREEARAILINIVARLERVAPRVAHLLEEAESDLLAFLDFPAEHRSKLRSTNPFERVNREIGRRSDVIGIYPPRRRPDPPRLDPDAGAKEVDGIHQNGFPRVQSGASTGARYSIVGDDMGRIDLSDQEERLEIGTSIEIIPPHCYQTVIMYSHYHIVRGDALVDIWPLDAWSSA